MSWQTNDHNQRLWVENFINAKYKDRTVYINTNRNPHLYTKTITEEILTIKIIEMWPRTLNIHNKKPAIRMY